MYLPRLVHVFHLYSSVTIVMDIIISASFVCMYIHIYLAGYDETDLLPEIVDRLSVKKYDSSYSVADSGFGSTGSMFSLSSHLSQVRSKSCNAVYNTIISMIFNSEADSV